MCECKKKNMEAAINHLQNNHSDKYQVGKLATLANEGAVRVENRLVAVGYDVIEVWVQPRKKDGSLGNSKKRPVIFTHSFCPHCGEKQV